MRREVTAFVVAGLLASAGTYAATGRQPGADDLRQVDNLAACYTEGIDAISAGHDAQGLATWRPCFADDYTFTMNLGTPVTCPGPQCPLPPGKPLDQRAQFARQVYDRAGFVATSHHLTSLGVEFHDAKSAHLKGHLQAWHWTKAGTVVIGLGTWDIEARKAKGAWRVVEENLVSSHGTVVRAPTATGA